ncbi:MAG: ribonuclease H-like domain-containing protein [Parachlamydiaceae bacterium]|nr:ribonuclease H-like domain-containing protein [Parachlamydiaceae bacterium]
MLTRTFAHIDGITSGIEKLLSERGITQWHDLLSQLHLFSEIPKTKLEKIKNGLTSSIEAFAKNDFHFFKQLLKPKEHWRLCNMGKICYVDIETTGLSKWSNEITMIGVYDGTLPHIYVSGKNLQEAHEKIREFDIVVTFNGKQFDLPFIEHHFSHSYDVVHLDLRYMLKELGLTGGLKSIEYQLGICRDADLQGVDGFEAVRLWSQYKRGNQAALKKLLRYNEQDIVNLKTLLGYYLDKKLGNYVGKN